MDNQCSRWELVEDVNSEYFSEMRKYGFYDEDLMLFSTLNGIGRLNDIKVKEEQNIFDEKQNESSSDEPISHQPIIEPRKYEQNNIVERPERRRGRPRGNPPKLSEIEKKERNAELERERRGGINKLYDKLQKAIPDEIKQRFDLNKQGGRVDNKVSREALLRATLTYIEEIRPS